MLLGMSSRHFPQELPTVESSCDARHVGRVGHVNHKGHEGHKGHKGRGALSSTAHRFESLAREAVDDGWTAETDERAPETVIIEEQAKSIIAHNDSPDVPFDQSVNPYRGCEHDMWNSLGRFDIGGKGDCLVGSWQP